MLYACPPYPPLFIVHAYLAQRPLPFVSFHLWLSQPSTIHERSFAFICECEEGGVDGHFGGDGGSSLRGGTSVRCCVRSVAGIKRAGGALADRRGGARALRGDARGGARARAARGRARLDGRLLPRQGGRRGGGVRGAHRRRARLLGRRAPADGGPHPRPPRADREPLVRRVGAVQREGVEVHASLLLAVVQEHVHRTIARGECSLNRCHVDLHRLDQLVRVGSRRGASSSQTDNHMHHRFLSEQRMSQTKRGGLKPTGNSTQGYPEAHAIIQRDGPRLEQRPQPQAPHP